MLLSNRKYFLPFDSVCPGLIEMDENVINKCVYKSSVNTLDHFDNECARQEQCSRLLNHVH